MTKDDSDRESAGRVCVPFGRAGYFLLFLATCQPGSADTGTSFTYQGRLRDSLRPAAETYDFTFALFDAGTNGTQISSTITNLGLPVPNMDFTASLDFGSNAFNGDPRWLEISVRRDTNDFTVLSPRQQITPAPYALAATTLTTPLQSALLPSNVSKLDTPQTFTGSNFFLGPAVFTNGANYFSGAFYGDGASLSNITSTAVRRAIVWPLPTLATNYVLDFSTDIVQVNAANNINFTQSTNRPGDGYYTECVWYVQSGSTNRLLSFNPSWIPLGTLATNWPCLLMSNKTAVIAFSVRGGSETNVVYAVSRQE